MPAEYLFRRLTFRIVIFKERNTETVSETAALTDDQEEDGLRPGQEVVTFKHVCGTCGHVIALHRHDFWVEADYQACVNTIRLRRKYLQLT